ncbi:LuxR C-terminal-related transcriptional regulator [Streptomyces sp. NPDC006012]|uniref:helix-turn-helix transcriptional regulator n=1 Tax=Streptomyces sp. NPDC006012 TaxID=3364739 RepID=UPI0036CBF88A
MSAHMWSGDRDLVGRGSAQELVAALPAALSGGGRVLHLSGHAGTGKTALLQFAGTEAERLDIPVLATAWAPAERGLRHAALHGLLHPLLARLTDVPAQDRSVLEEAFGGAAQPAPQQLAVAALRLLATAPGPVLVCVDDFDRLDDASRDTLREMARRCGGTQVGMIVAQRAEPAAPLAPDALAVTLGPLSDPQARELVERSGRVTSYAEQELVLAVAAGNPLALTELSLNGTGLMDAAGLGMLPATPRLAEAYAEDLADLSAPARGVLLVAALSMSSLTQDVLGAGTRLLAGDAAARSGVDAAARSGLDESGQHGSDEVVRSGLDKDVRSGLDEVVRRGLVADHGDRLRFAQPLLRVAVLHLESAARRMTAHAALGRSVTSPLHAAWHTAQCTAGVEEELAGRLDALADGPCQGTAVLTFLAALECAARLSADSERAAGRLQRAAELAAYQGLEEQARRYARGIDVPELGEYGRAVQLWLHDLMPSTSSVGRDRVPELCSAARAVAASHPELAQKLLHAAAGRCWWQQAGPAERRTVVEAVEDLRPRPWNARDLAIMALVEPLAVSRVPLHPAPGQADRFVLGQTAHLTGDLGRAALLLKAAEADVRAAGRHLHLPQILVARALVEVWLASQWQSAEAMTEEARTVALRTGQTRWAARATGAQGVIKALQGRHDKALECAAEVEEASLHLGYGKQLRLAALTRALTASGTGRYAEGYAHLRSLFTELTTPYSFEQLWGLAFLVEAARPAGRLDDARDVVGQVESMTRTGRGPLLARVLTYAEATLAPDEEAEARYRAALGDGAEGWPLLYGMTQFSYGAWLRRGRRVVESRGPLATAENVFRKLGARTRADLAALELRATGGAEAESESIGDEVSRVLSPQQLTIARLAARGLSNRAIGEQLRLSPRTVASHLYQIFPKLGVSSRMQLAERLKV